MGLNLPVEMRTAPSFSLLGTINCYNGQGTFVANNTNIAQAWTTPRSCDWDSNIASISGSAQGNSVVTYTYSSGTVGGYAVFDAEL
jgi:hypothetical protein